MDLVRRREFDPSDFDWTEVAMERVPTVADEARVSCLNHSYSGYRFVFDLRNEGFWGIYSPGGDSPTASTKVKNFDALLDVAEYWLVCLKTELEAEMDEIELRRHQRFELLRSIYRLSGGDCSKPISLAEAAELIKLDSKLSLLICEYLENEGLVTVLGESAEDLAIALTHKGLKVVENESKEPAKRTREETVIDASRDTNSVKLFISHSSQDSTLAAALIELLRSGLNLKDHEIRCTSVDGYRLPGGADTDKQILHEISSSSAFIGLLTPNSMRSTYVVFELGARWGAQRHMLPLLAPGIDAEKLSGPISQKNALRVDNRSQLFQLVDDLSKELGIRASSPASYEKHITTILSIADSMADVKH